MITKYFTFGQSHMTNHPLPLGSRRLADCWVEVLLPNNRSDHRELFIELFTSRYCPTPDQFAFEYDASEFDPDYFPGGRIARITEHGLSDQT